MKPTRKQTKFDMFSPVSISEHRRTRPGETVCKCQLCGLRDATDLHEITGRSRIATEETPEEFLSALCNWCNVNIADKSTNCQVLLLKNVEQYGLERIRRVYAELPARSQQRTLFIPRMLDQIELYLRKTSNAEQTPGSDVN